MQKLVIKTVIIALLCIIVLASVVFGALFFFSPKTIGKVSDKLGNYSLSAKAYERQYLIEENDENFTKLNLAYTNYAFSLIENEDYEKAVSIIIDFSVDSGRTLSDNTLRIVKAKLEVEKKKADEKSRQIISNCIDKINVKINNYEGENNG